MQPGTSKISYGRSERSVVKGANNIGGIVGNNSSGTVEESYNAGYSVTGTGKDIGGIAGINSGTITKTYNRAYITGSSEMGGLVGKNSSTLSYSYNAGTVVGTTAFGPIIGVSGGSNSYDYYLKDTCNGPTVTTVGTSKTETEMKSLISSLGGTSYWKQDTYTNEGFPILKNNAQDRGIYNSTQNGDYGFEVSNNTLIAKNTGIDNSIAHNYVVVDLTDITPNATYDVIVNASITSETDRDYGFATITTFTDTPQVEVNDQTSEWQFMKISGTQSSKNYTTTLTGGFRYILHLAYSKDASGKATGENFTVNSVTVVTSELQIGDYVNYNCNTSDSYTSKAETNGYTYGYSDEGDQVFNTNSYKGKWKVLGVENGKVQIIPEDMIVPDSGAYKGKHTTYENGEYCLSEARGYNNGISELNNICEIYGHGTGAESARSMIIKDINKVMDGIDPEKSFIRDGDMSEYGNTVTYGWDGSKVKYTWNNISETSKYEKFQYPNGNEKVDLAKGSTKQYTSTYYGYNPKTFKVSNTIENVTPITEETNVYKLLFNYRYFLADTYVMPQEGYVSFGFHSVSQDGRVVNAGALLSREVTEDDEDYEEGGIWYWIALRLCKTSCYT